MPASPVPSFTDLSDARAVVIDRTKEVVASLDASQVDDILSLSSANDSESTCQYRPYLVAGVFLLQNFALTGLESVGSISFRHVYDIVRSLFTLQSSIDRAMGIVPPDGFDIQTWIRALDSQAKDCGCAGDTGISPSTPFAATSFGPSIVTF